MENLDIHISDEVMTADGKMLGEARILYIQPDPEQIAPEEKLYKAYLRVANYMFGEHFYIPTEFIDHDKSANGHLVLRLTYAEVESHAFGRQPEFVAFGRATKQLLGERV